MNKRGFVKTRTARKIYHDLYHPVVVSKDNKSKLIRAAMKRGLHSSRAEKVVDEILVGLGLQNAAMRELVQNPSGVLDDLLQVRPLSDRQVEDLYTLMKAAEEPALSEELMEQQNNGEVGRWILDRMKTRSGGIDLDEKRQVVVSRLRGLNISKEAMKTLLNVLTSWEMSDQAKEEALEEASARTAMIALHLYLDNQDVMTPEQAAVSAGMEADILKIQEALEAGNIVSDSILDKGRWIVQLVPKFFRTCEKGLEVLVELLPEVAVWLFILAPTFLLGAVVLEPLLCLEVLAVTVLLVLALMVLLTLIWLGSYLGGLLFARVKATVAPDEAPDYDTDEISYEEQERIWDALVY